MQTLRQRSRNFSSIMIEESADGSEFPFQHVLYNVIPLEKSVSARKLKINVVELVCLAVYYNFYRFNVLAFKAVLL